MRSPPRAAWSASSSCPTGWTRRIPGPGSTRSGARWHELREWSGGSWQHVAIGTDFDGFTDPPDDCTDAASSRGCAAAAKNGLAPADVEAVLGGNARRVLRDGWR